MAGKPLSIAAVLQQGLPKQKHPTGINLKNRWDPLRDRSASAASGRHGSPLKRRRSASPVPVDKNEAFKAMEDEEVKLARAREILVRAKAGMLAAKAQGMKGAILDVLDGIVEWMDITTGVQETTANVVVDSFNRVVGSPRKSRKEAAADLRMRAEQADPEKERNDLRRKKFGQEVREAERSSLLFRTNMGTVPVMNPETMKTRFSLDLAAKAAAVEKREDGRPSADVTAQLDDALAMVTKMEFFGRVTKKAYKKGKDGELEDFFTVPVKLIYKDRETREAAESRMRGLCNTSGTVPYHRTLRNVITAAVDEAKKEFPDNWIQVKVDTENFVLKVSRREGRGAEGIWYNNIAVIQLPDSVMDLSRMGPKTHTNQDRDAAMEETSGETRG